MLETQFVTVHGHKRAYVKAGPTDRPGAPVILLLHGLGCDRHTWDEVIEDLAATFVVIAPDFLGHGESAKPRADYSVAGYANGMRDLLTVLGVDKATVVGHSFGGGVAAQFAYQFPERTERLVLVDSGGMGKEVTPLIRAYTLPLSMTVVALATLPGPRHVLTAGLRSLGRIDSKLTRDLGEVATIVEALKAPRMRYALNRLVNGVIDYRGQVVTIRDRAYLTEEMPMAVIWGAEDLVLPAKQGREILEFAPNAQLTIFPKVGHFPMKKYPEEFVRLLKDFVDSTEPAKYHRARWRALLKAGAKQRPLRVVSEMTMAPSGSSTDA
ncbi:putative hydrolase [Nocardioides baekrokdamisoli]|uniref:Putative hydrolase n=1 Tax=Nocardioides baekrokdamisoli TaxID=1804624 RepID=A0A3G9J415_9ACTN|nr:alpha/beta fold hydrolase [Nocardioides baekrokdamisoli]BBH18378.1 putative hydrolase [Nocardioides baekrokdamisoli]